MYPPKNEKNGTRHQSDTTRDPWPGDTYTSLSGILYQFQSDGSGWKTINASVEKAA